MTKWRNINQDFIKFLDGEISQALLSFRISTSQKDIYYTKQNKKHMDFYIIQNMLEQDSNVIVYYPNETLQYFVAPELRAIIVRNPNYVTKLCVD
ncbi:hypothetical protein H5410_000867 [Solanum commersonii]|uniref:Uncharacterized protein n=1 Tax=Solanum commersonii TaxID=4109 RepID=A0A9J6AXA1_SOLCO|nr:hypothetical protein H5410_000867 [Solanum commersonii]